tara:strand:+ start:175 stop:810 length:636 start_codon:yes stop_codon:yes gene_type:complete
MDNAIKTAAEIPGGFLIIEGYRNSKGEIARHTINANPSYSTFMDRKQTALSAWLLALPRIDTTAIAGRYAITLSGATKADRARFDSEAAYFAAVTVEVSTSIAAKIARLKGDVNAPVNPTVLADYDLLAPGVKRHIGDGSLHVSGLFVGKIVTTEGKRVNSREKTILKRAIESACADATGMKVPAWVQYRLTADRFESVTGNHCRILSADL